MERVNKERLIKYLLLIIIGELLLFALPKEMHYSNRFAFLIGALVLIFIAMPFCFLMVLNELSNNSNIRILAFVTIMINGPLFGYYHQQIEKSDLLSNGKWSKGVVIDKKYNSTKSGDEWTVKSEYLMKGKLYTTTYDRIIDEEKYNIGDSIEIILLEEYPAIYRIEDQWVKISKH